MKPQIPDELRGPRQTAFFTIPEDFVLKILLEGFVFHANHF